jgi:hypothetical protein
LILLSVLPDFDSAIRRFDPSRPSQIQHADFVKGMALLKEDFPAHLEIPLTSHLEILCWFRFWSKADESARALNVRSTYQDTN